MNNNKRRVFWSQQIQKNTICQTPKLNITKKNNFSYIDTKDKIKSLILNILFTDGEKPYSICGERVGDRGGHWSSSFSGFSVGTVWNLDSATNKDEKAVLAKTIASNSLQKLINYGVATDVKVNSYIEDNNLMLDITVYGVGFGQTKILIQKTPLKNGWIWE